MNDDFFEKLKDERRIQEMTDWTHTIVWDDSVIRPAKLVGQDHHGEDVFSYDVNRIERFNTRSILEIEQGAIIRERHPLDGVEPGTLVMVWGSGIPESAHLVRFQHVAASDHGVIDRNGCFWLNALTVEQYAEKYL